MRSCYFRLFLEKQGHRENEDNGAKKSSDGFVANVEWYASSAGRAVSFESNGNGRVSR